LKPSSGCTGEGGFEGVTLGQARVRLMHELLAGRYRRRRSGRSASAPKARCVQQRFYVAEVRMDPSGRDGRFALVRHSAA
jgi:branched-chain amino acid transport system substrate-binding protein